MYTLYNYLYKLTSLVWPVNVLITEPSDTFHNLIILSLLPLANVNPSGEKATVLTYK
jgi:hypothetical protein